MGKVKIILDADVLIHFSKAEKLSLLPNILPEYECSILSAVYEEVISLQKQIDNQVTYMKNMSVTQFNPLGHMKREYVRLRTKYGKGESACMAYCKFTKDVIGSSNLRDIKAYCTEHHITYLTTLDFVYYAFVRGIMTKEECNSFIKDVNSKGSKLPTVNIEAYSPNSLI